MEMIRWKRLLIAPGRGQLRRQPQSVRPLGHAARQLSAVSRMVKGTMAISVHRVDKPVTWRSDTVAFEQCLAWHRDPEGT